MKHLVIAVFCITMLSVTSKVMALNITGPNAHNGFNNVNSGASMSINTFETDFEQMEEYRNEHFPNCTEVSQDGSLCKELPNPEPGTFLLIAIGLGSAVLMRKKFKAKTSIEK